MVTAALAAATLTLAVVVGVSWGRNRCGHHLQVKPSGEFPPVDAGGDNSGGNSPGKLPSGDWYTYRPVPPGWNGHPDAIELPTCVVWALTAPNLTSWQAGNQADRIAHWRTVLADEGQTEPFRVLVDSAGRARLEDGYRRLAASRQLGAPTVGISIQRVATLKGAPMLVEVMLRHAQALGWRQ